MSFANPSGIAIPAGARGAAALRPMRARPRLPGAVEGGARQDLSPKAFQLLELLLEHRPRALTKQELHDRLWPDAFVSDSSLPRLVAEVRAAIGDDAKAPRLLRTVHRFGYAFFGAVAPEAAEGEPTPSAVPTHLGRSPDPPAARARTSSDARPRPGSGSTSRACPATTRASWCETAGRSSKTWAAGTAPSCGASASRSPTELADGDEICIGPVVLVFRTSLGNSTTESGTAA